MMKGETLISVLANGGVAVIKTDTIYGVVGQALNQATVERVYEIKKRTPEKPFIILISDLSELNKFDIRLNKYQRNCLNEWWPGGVSVIFDLQGSAFDYLHRGSKSLSFRVPGEESLRNILRETGPLVAPSANPEGAPPAKNIQEAKHYFENQVDLYLDGGVAVGEPSTLVALKKSNWEIVRQGVINL